MDVFLSLDDTAVVKIGSLLYNFSFISCNAEKVPVVVYFMLHHSRLLATFRSDRPFNNEDMLMMLIHSICLYIEPFSKLKHRNDQSGI